MIRVMAALLLVFAGASLALADENPLLVSPDVPAEPNARHSVQQSSVSNLRDASIVGMPRSNPTDRREWAANVRRLQRRLCGVAKKQPGRRFHALYERLGAPSPARDPPLSGWRRNVMSQDLVGEPCAGSCTRGSKGSLANTGPSTGEG